MHAHAHELKRTQMYIGFCAWVNKVFKHSQVQSTGFIVCWVQSRLYPGVLDERSQSHSPAATDTSPTYMCSTRAKTLSQGMSGFKFCYCMYACICCSDCMCMLVHCILCVLFAGQKKTVHRGRGLTKTALPVPTPKKTACRVGRGRGHTGTTISDLTRGEWV